MADPTRPFPGTLGGHRDAVGQAEQIRDREVTPGRALLLRLMQKFPARRTHLVVAGFHVRSGLGQFLGEQRGKAPERAVVLHDFPHPDFKGLPGCELVREPTCSRAEGPDPLVHHRSGKCASPPEVAVQRRRADARMPGNPLQRNQHTFLREELTG